MFTLAALIISYMVSSIVSVTNSTFVHDKIRVYQVSDLYVVYGCYESDRNRPQVVDRVKAFNFIPSGLGNLNIERGIQFNGQGAVNMCNLLNNQDKSYSNKGEPS